MNSSARSPGSCDHNKRAPDFSQAHWRKICAWHRGVRDSELGEASPVLAFDQQTWSAFLTAVKAGELD
ncbi:DUF397 domain-containing protein [Saccharopolyspora shandongensis]|uniref:DUF397 domain-containing protein n=1 Tax=Saccharopolyspora shandongensis TaxID=418495 RepID=UPI003F4DF953